MANCAFADALTLMNSYGLIASGSHTNYTRVGGNALIGGDVLGFGEYHTQNAPTTVPALTAAGGLALGASLRTNGPGVHIGGSVLGSINNNGGGSIYVGSVLFGGSINNNANGSGATYVIGDIVGSVYTNGGNTVYGGTLFGIASANGGGSVVRNQAVTRPFEPSAVVTDAISTMTTFSSQLQVKTANSSYSFSGGRVTFTAVGDSSGLAVFTISDANSFFAAAAEIEFNLASSAQYVLINVVNAFPSLPLTIFANFLSGSAGNYGSRIIWNFQNATSIFFNSQFGGSVIALGADLWINQNVEGSVVAKSVTQFGDINYRPPSTSFPTVAAASFDHLQISATSATPVTCSPLTFTVTACQNPACSSLYSSGVTGTLTASGTATVVWGGGSGAFSIPSGSSSTTKTIQITTPASAVTLGIAAAPSPVPSAAAICSLGGSASCSLSAADSGFLLTVPNIVAGNTGRFTVQAVKKADNSAVCVPAFASVSKTVRLVCDYSNPSTGSASVRIAAAGSISVTPSTACAAAGVNLTQAFDTTGTSNVDFSYADAGQIAVTASYTGSGSDAGLSMTGSGSFVSVPSAFTFSAIQQTASPYLANPAASSASGSAFVRAGESFSATITAVNAAGTATANFGRESSPATVTLSRTVVAPGGGATGTLSGSFGSFSGGSATGTGFSWSEVGILSLTASVSNYLASGLNVSGSSGNIGRFIPDHFTLTSPSLTNRTAGACSPASTYSQLGEAMGLSFTVTAQNQSGATTQNYAGSFAKLDPSQAANWSATNPGVALSVANGATSLASRVSIANAAGTWASGISSFSADVTVARAATPDGPFDSVTLTAKPKDSDGVTSSTTSLGSTRLRFGRLRLQNAYGSEMLRLPVPLTVEYYNGSRFVTNTDDACTRFSSTPVTSSAPTSYRAGDLQFSNATSGLTVGGALPSLGATVSAGVGRLILAAPGVGHSGSMDLSLISPDWLDFDWDGDGAYDDDPVARIVFGVQKQNPLDRRERY